MKNDNPAGRNEFTPRLCRSLRDAVAEHNNRRRGIRQLPKFDMNEKANALLAEGARVIRKEFPHLTEKEAREIFSGWSFDLLLSKSNDEIRAFMAAWN